ncbi:MAG: extracellular solute-binding protein [Oscillospiraceae bacterium]|nr:extracellular solute-binding protein [Oscillospiraceae bacterium]
MKRKIALLLSVCMLLLTVAACGTGNQAGGATTAAATTAAAAATTAAAAAAATEAATTAAAGAAGTTAAATTAAAAATTTAAAAAADPAPALDAKPMRYYMPGSSKIMGDEMNAVINEKLAQDGVPVIFEPIYAPWDQWVNKINIMLSSGDEFELLHIMEDYIPTSVYAGRGGLTPLDDLIPQYAPELFDLFEQVLWDCATVGGTIYSIPAFWRDNSGDGEGKINLRKDKFDEFGLPYPQSHAEAIEILPVFQQMWKDQDGIERYIFEHSATRCPVAFHRLYDTWPFYASQDGIFKVTQDAQATLYFESDEFRMDTEFMHEMYKNNLIHPDVLNLPNDIRSDILNQGDFVMCIMTGPGNPAGIIQQTGIETVEIEQYVFEPEKPYLCNLPLLNSNGIPSTANNPELALLFLNWLYSSKENQDLLLHGVKGVTWNEVGPDMYERIKNENNQNLYAFDAWMIEHVKFHRFDVIDMSTDIQKADTLGNIHADNMVYSPMVGFNFDSEPVSTEMANLMAEYTASLLPIKLGLLPYEGNFERAMDKMRAAGCDRVIEEYQKQLDAYIASKG